MTTTSSKQSQRFLPTIALQKKLALVLLIAQGGITVTGSIVRVTGSGLGCNTWPQCHEGSLVPLQGAAPWIHQAIEFGNRLLTFVLVGFVVALFVTVTKARRRKEIRYHSFIQGLGVVAQAVIGGISVLLDLKWWAVALHFLPSMLLVWLAAMLYLRIQEPDDVPSKRSYASSLRGLAVFCGLLLSAVLVTGTMVTGAGPHSGDQGVGMEGRLQVDLEWIAHVHAYTMYTYLGFLLLLLLSLVLQSAPARVRKFGVMLVIITILQAIIGVIQFRMGVPRWTVPVHIGLSSCVVAFCSFVYTLGMWRVHQTDPTTTTGSLEGDKRYHLIEESV